MHFLAIYFGLIILSPDSNRKDFLHVTQPLSNPSLLIRLAYRIYVPPNSSNPFAKVNSKSMCI